MKERFDKIGGKRSHSYHINTTLSVIWKIYLFSVKQKKNEHTPKVSAMNQQTTVNINIVVSDDVENVKRKEEEKIKFFFI